MKDYRYTVTGDKKMQISDGFHTMDELYTHRDELFITLCRHMHDLLGLENPGKYKIWRSRCHFDGTMYDDCFIMGIGTESGHQITYHLPMLKWPDTEFAEFRDRAPQWDGHKSRDVLERLKNL